MVTESPGRRARRLRPTHVFSTWSRSQTEAENLWGDAGMPRDLLAFVGPHGSLRHVALVTGPEHHLGTFES